MSDLSARFARRRRALAALDESELSGLETARERAEDLREGFGSTAVAFGEFEILTTLSIGISVYPGNGTSPDELIRSADRALYRAKHQGRNCTEIAHAVVR